MKIVVWPVAFLLVGLWPESNKSLFNIHKFKKIKVCFILLNCFPLVSICVVPGPFHCLIYSIVLQIIFSYIKTIHYSRFKKNKPFLNQHQIWLGSTYKGETKETQQEEVDKPKPEQLLVLLQSFREVHCCLSLCYKYLQPLLTSPFQRYPLTEKHPKKCILKICPWT